MITNILKCPSFERTLGWLAIGKLMDTVISDSPQAVSDCRIEQRGMFSKLFQNIELKLFGNHVYLPREVGDKCLIWKMAAYQTHITTLGFWVKDPCSENS